MSSMQPVRGTHDLFDDNMLRYRHVVNTAQRLSEKYGFGEIKTPIFEFSHVFARTLGDASDIVTKEMYTFTDKGGDMISLRPEGTASVIRALISNGLAQNMPLKYFYEGPMFRYERPQKGRYRQFYQLGVELIGTDNADADIEVVSLAYRLLESLQLLSKVTLEINSIGDKESRDSYRAELVRYYKQHESELSADSLKRLSVNPMRILDSKDPKDAVVNAAAPRLTDYLNATSKEKFDKIKASLTALGIAYTVNPQLVRGLDYYCHLVFEFRTTALGAQDAVLSGGRYDGLSEMMGGPKAPAVGWAAGVERLCLLLEQSPAVPRPISIIPLGEAAERYALQLAHDLRGAGMFIDMAYGGNMSNRMKKATKAKAIAALIIGDNELQSKNFSLKTLDSGVQETVSEAQLKPRLAQFFCK